MSITKSHIAKAIAIASLLAATTGTAAHATTAPLALGSPYTDNYKASYNADPSVPELRTWLATKSVSVGTLVFKPTAPATGMAYVGAQDGVSVRGSDGTTAVLRAKTTSTNTLGQGFFRTDANGDFGLLIQEKSVAALKTAPIHETLSLSGSGSVIASSTVDYTYDQMVAGAAPGSVEYNGPGGRWYVAGSPTRLNWETSPPAPPTGPDKTAPSLSSVTLPGSTTKRAISVQLGASDNVAVTEVRFANEDGNWTPWQPFAATKSWTLSAGAGSKGVFAQVRDAAHNESRSICTRTTCTAPCS